MILTSRIADNKNLHLILILFAVVSIFGKSIFFDFVWDDKVLLLGQDVYKNFNIKKILLSPANNLEYLPVRDLSYALDYLIWGQNPLGFHLTNIILYFINALFIYFMTLEITSLLFSVKQDKTTIPFQTIAFFTTILFVVHPIHIEAVSFITCRNVLLSGLFFFLSCFFYLRFLKDETNPKNRYWVAALFCYVLALFSKATSIILPLILLLFSVFIKKERLKKKLMLIPFFIISGATFLLFKTVATQAKLIIQDQMIVFGALNISSKIAVASQIPFFYLKKILVPWGFSVNYMPKFTRAIVNLPVISAMLALALIVGIGIIFRKTYPEILFAQCWFLIALVPVLNFFVTSVVVADRYVYLSSYAFFYFLTFLMYNLHNKIPRNWILVFFVLIITAWSFLAVKRNDVWKSNKTLWENTIRVSPDAITTYHNLGSLYFNENNYDKAFNLFEKAKTLVPSNNWFEYYKGLQSYNNRDFPDTFKWLQKALTINEHSREALFLIGKTYERTGNIDKAIESYLKVLESKEVDWEGKKDLARKRLGILQIKLIPQLNKLRRKVETNTSDLNARAQLAVFLDKTGLYNEALENYVKIEKIGGEHWALFYNMGGIYKKLGRYEKAASYYEKSLVLNKNNVDTYNNLGLVYKILKKYGRAIKAFEDAMKTDNTFRYAPYNLAILYFHLGDKKNALRYFNHVQKFFPYLKNLINPYLQQLE